MKKTESLSQPVNKNLERRFRKIDDINYSLFEEEYKTFRLMRTMLISMLTFGVVFFIPGLLLTIWGFIAIGVPLLSLGSFGFMIVVYVPIHLKDRAKFNSIIELKEQKNIQALATLAQKYSKSNGLLDQEKAELATYVLVDMKSIEIAHILKNRLIQRRPQNVRNILRSFYLLAIKMGYSDHKELFFALQSGKSLQKPAHKGLVDESVDMDVVVPITKVFFLEEIPDNAKCMVSSLVLDFNIDQVVVCPYCSAFAKKNLLAGWLIEKQSCPVCQRKLRIEDCPEVRFGSKAKFR